MRKDIKKFFEDNFYLWDNKTFSWRWREDYDKFPISKKLKEEIIKILKNTRRRKNET